MTSGAADARNKLPKFRLRNVREPAWRYDTVTIAAMVLVGMLVIAFLPRWLIALYWALVATSAGFTFWGWKLYGQLQKLMREMERRNV